jgi:putative component of membrane protein insertase Oxa1/YidC/SpoIIIJ protein YidD
MITPLLLALLLFGIAPGEGAPEEGPWEPSPARTWIAAPEVQTPGESSVVGSVIDLTLAVYRFVLSEQQGDICVFSPSCSHYAEQAVDSCGVVLGGLLIADRLERCNWTAWNYSSRYYPVVSRNGRMLLSDPVRANICGREAPK